MSFSPELMGFMPVTRRGCSGKKRVGCILATTTHGKSASGRTKTTAKMTLDDDTTKLATDLFGESCGVAVDERARIVLYAGSSRILSRAKNAGAGNAVISLGSETERFVKVLGSFYHYMYVSETIAGGEAILLTPTRRID